MKIGLKTSETGVFLVNYGGDTESLFTIVMIVASTLLARKNQKSATSADLLI